MMRGSGKSDPEVEPRSRRTRQSDPLRSWRSQGRGPRGMRISKARAGRRTG